ncbi:hypothetical protein [Hyphomicrobium sp. 1Nfss2.1]|uniref:hypothetical protein n=1 Tax=Hyphomicrobium sp. 1Nfss2.1 TaxID=3413936 RepID=UPI003C7C5C1C
MRTGKSEELTKLIGRRLKEMLGADEEGPMGTSAAIRRGLEALRSIEHGPASPSHAQSSRNDVDTAMFSDNVATSPKIDVG